MISLNLVPIFILKQFSCKMRFATTSILALIFIQSLSAQSWEIHNTELKAERRGEKLVISYLDQRDSLVIIADTAYMSENLEQMYVLKNSLIGIVDPFDLYLLQAPSLISLTFMNDEFLLVEDSEGYFLSYIDFPVQAVSHRFESVEKLRTNNDEGWDADELIIVKRDGRYGIKSTWMDKGEYLVSPNYDEIIVNETDDFSYYYYLRKGNKWGAGSCNGIEVEAKYDEIEYLGGECGETAYIVWKNYLGGVVSQSSKKPLIGLDYTDISTLIRASKQYLFLFVNEYLKRMYISDGSQEWVDYYEPIMLVRIVSEEKTFLIYGAEEELLSLELSKVEIQRLGLISLEILYLDY